MALVFQTVIICQTKNKKEIKPQSTGTLIKELPQWTWPSTKYSFSNMQLVVVAFNHSTLHSQAAPHHISFSFILSSFFFSQADWPTF